MTSDGSAAPLTRRAAALAFIPQSPMNALLGIRVIDIGDDRAELLLPYRPELTTLADVSHGGAIATLLDVVGAAAAWADDSRPDQVVGSTVSLTINYLAPARGTDITGVGTVTRRGRSLCFVDVTAATGGTIVATGQLIHRYA